MINPYEEVVTSSTYHDCVIQLVKSHNGGERYRVFDNTTGMKEPRFVRLFEAKRFIRSGFVC